MTAYKAGTHLTGSKGSKAIHFNISDQDEATIIGLHNTFADWFLVDLMAETNLEMQCSISIADKLSINN